MVGTFKSGISVNENPASLGTAMLSGAVLATIGMDATGAGIGLGAGRWWVLGWADCTPR